MLRRREYRYALVQILINQIIFGKFDHEKVI